MYHPSPFISKQAKAEDLSPLKTPALQLLFSDVTAPPSSHIPSTHYDIYQALQSSEWDFATQIHPPLPVHPLQLGLDVSQTNLVFEQQVPVADYLSCLLPSATEEQRQHNPPDGHLDTSLHPSVNWGSSESAASSQCELSQIPCSQYNQPLPPSIRPNVEPTSTLTPVQSSQTQPPAVLTRQNVRCEWASVPIRQTIVPSSCIPPPVPESPPSTANSKSSGDIRPKLRFSKGASASKYCHICGRNSKTVSVSQCSNIGIGLCRKVVCEKCLMLHREEIGSACGPSSQWKCTHCEGVCPKRARCHQYTKNNLRRRMKNDSKQTKKLQEIRKRRSELAIEERARELMELTRKNSNYEE